jgi:hypothetical protein
MKYQFRVIIEPTNFIMDTRKVESFIEGILRSNMGLVAKILSVEFEGAGTSVQTVANDEQKGQVKE